jgi:hypothetical protein
MRRAIRFARRNLPLVAVTAALMAGAGCVGAVRETGERLTEDALKPITVPIDAYGQALDAASNVRAVQRERFEGYEEPAE